MKELIKTLYLQSALIALPLAANAMSQTTDTDSLQANVIDSLISDHTLDDVVVVSQRQLVKSDAEKMTYDVQADEESKTKTIMEMLKKVPLVTVDGNDNITVKGSSNFKIYKNGHPDPSFSSNPKEVLKSIPASSIKKIEVITEPGAKYDAEGVSAILNIVMADGSRLGGVAGTLMSNVSTRNTMAGTYVTAQMGKLVLSANYGAVFQNGKKNRNRNQAETVYGDSGNRQFTDYTNESPADVQFANIDMSLEIDSLNLLTLSGGGYTYNVDVTGSETTSMESADGSPIYKYKGSYYFPKYAYHNWNGRMDYQHKTHREGEILTLSYMFALTNNKDCEIFDYENILNMPMTYNGYTSDKHERFYEHTAQIDWVRPFAKYHKIETGMKYIYRLNKSSTLMDYNGGETEDTNSEFRHTTHVAAAYMQYLLNIGKWSVRTGLRYEFSRMKAEYPDGSNESFSTNLSDLVPSASVFYRISDANSIKLSYATSIYRPGISYLNPAVVSTPMQVSFGNPDLSSSRNTMLGLTYTHTGTKLTYNINPYYQFMNNNITSVNYLQDGIIHSTYANVLRYRVFGTNAYIQCQPWKDATVMMNGSVQYTKHKNPNIDLANSAWTGNVSCNISQKLPWKLSAYCGGGGQIGHDATNVYGFGTTWYYYYIGIQRTFLKEDRLTINISANNPIGSTYHHYHFFTTQGDYTGNHDSWSRGKDFSIGISLRLGKLKATVKKAERSIENSDVVGGIEKKN